MLLKNTYLAAAHAWQVVYGSRYPEISDATVVMSDLFDQWKRDPDLHENTEHLRFLHAVNGALGYVAKQAITLDDVLVMGTPTPNSMDSLSLGAGETMLSICNEKYTQNISFTLMPAYFELVISRPRLLARALEPYRGQRLDFHPHVGANERDGDADFLTQFDDLEDILMFSAQFGSNVRSEQVMHPKLAEPYAQHLLKILHGCDLYSFGGQEVYFEQLIGLVEDYLL